MDLKNIELSFHVEPALRDAEVSLETRRNLYLFGKEAIYNLVKYSKASIAVVRFECGSGKLSVIIEDNGTFCTRPGNCP